MEQPIRPFNLLLLDLNGNVGQNRLLLHQNGEFSYPSFHDVLPQRLRDFGFRLLG